MKYGYAYSIGEGLQLSFQFFLKTEFLSKSAQKGRERHEKERRAAHSMHSLLDEGKITFGTGDVSDHEEKFSLLDDFHKFHAEAKTKTFPFPPLSKGDVIAMVQIQYQRRRVESNLAAIMMGYVLVFLICNFPRLMLNIDELARIR